MNTSFVEPTKYGSDLTKVKLAKPKNNSTNQLTLMPKTPYLEKEENQMTKEGDVDDRPEMPCTNCETVYRGFGCESTSKTMEDGNINLSCGFGSSNDLMKFVFAPGTFPDGEICDTCIKTAVLNGQMIDLNSYADGRFDNMPVLQKIRMHYPDITHHQLLKIEQLSTQRTQNATSQKPHWLGLGGLFNRGSQKSNR
jgi:hypothetical protein